MSIQARYLFGITCALLAATTISLVVVATRSLREVHFSIPTFYYLLSTTILMGFACLIWFFINLASNAEIKDWPFIYDSYIAYILVIAAGSINLIASNLMIIVNQK